MRLNTWDSILEQLRLIGTRRSDRERVDRLVELLVHLRLLGQDEGIPDLRIRSGDVEALHARVEEETRRTLNAVPSPSPEFVHYAREVLKKLPVRQDSEEMIERIRAEAESFEESRCEDDPFRGFAGDLRKEVHRRLSPRIITRYLDPYLSLTDAGDRAPLRDAGYVALAALADPSEESPEFVDLARDLRDRLEYLWDYGEGNLASVKDQLVRSLDLFDRCFLGAEVRGFLEMLTPSNLDDTLRVQDFLSRLASFKRFLRESRGEGRISLYDFLLLDLSLGRLVFLLANDLANNRYADVSSRNIRDALGVIREILGISVVKGLEIGDVSRHQDELEELRSSSVYDFVRIKRCLASVSGDLQGYLQSGVIDRMGGYLNRALEAYEVPTSRLSAIKTRFFNNFIRRTLIHVLSEFTEKTVGAVDQELRNRTEDRRLFSMAGACGDFGDRDPRDCVAATWRETEEDGRPMFGGKGNSILDMARLGLRVPPAFVLGYPLLSRRTPDGSFAPEVVSLVDEHLAELETRSGRRIGYPPHPLLVSIRSGAHNSLPGVLSTILNAGITPEVRAGIEGRRGPDLTTTLYRRFLENCAEALDRLEGRETTPGDRESAPRPGDGELERRLSSAFGESFLTDPREQILRCIRLVHASRSSRAVRDFSRTLAADVRVETAVTVQQLVFGNLNERSLSGVVITRNPITGDDEFFGEFKRRAQGEEVVRGSAGTEPVAGLPPETAAELEECKTVLVGRYRQDLDLEFTVEDGRLYLLQARAAVLGPFASLAADTDFLRRGLIGLTEFRERLERLETAYAAVALPRGEFRLRSWNPPLAVGVPINGGVITGTLVLTVERLREAENRRESVVYLAYTTKPTDFAVLDGAHAIVTVYPGRTSHAAITALSLNKPCIVGCEDVEIDYEGRSVRFRSAGGSVLREGERVTADGNTGALYRGIAPISDFFLSIADIRAALGDCGDAVQAADTVRGLIRAGVEDMRLRTRPLRAGLSESGRMDGRKVLVRVDANVEIRDGAVADERRLDSLLPVLGSLLERGAVPVLCSHLGDPGARPDERRTREELYRAYSLRPVAEVLGRRFGSDFVFHETSVGASGLLIGPRDIVPGKVNLLENLRFASGEKDNEDAFARSLAELSDGCFVNDAFNVCNRRHASITGVPRFARRRLAGPLVERELAVLSLLLDGPERPFFAVFGGRDLESQLGAAAALLGRADRIAFLPRSGIPDGLSAAGTDGNRIPGSASIRALLRSEPDKVLVPGEGTLEDFEERLAECLEGARTVLWSGFAGLEGPPGTPGAAEERAGPLRGAAKRASLMVVCSEEEKQLPGFDGPGFHLSKGPRAFLEYLERLSLPGITALDPVEIPHG